MRLSFIAVLLCSTVVLSSAQLPVFLPAPDNNALLASLYSKLENKHKQEIIHLPSENKKELSEVYKQRWNNIKELFDDKEIYTASTAQQFLDSLSAEIIKANPALQQQDFSCYFSRSGIPNASYVGEGIILFNMGLFQRLENESQAAFVLCHELSHFILNHSENSMRKYITTLNSKEVQQTLRKIKNSEYNKRQDIEQLMKGLTFDTRRHSRDHESEADSMAVELMRPTRFNMGASVTTLAILDSIDTDTLQTDLCLQKAFNFNDYPFHKKWIAKEDGLLGGHAQLKQNEDIADSLKTHPDCKLRIQYLKNIIAAHAQTVSSTEVTNKSRFMDLKKTFGYEIIEHAFKTNDYTKSLYYTIELLQSSPADPYLVTQVGKIFNGFYAAQKNHTAGKLTALPSPFFPSNYNLLLQFIQNLYKEDYASLSYHFLKQFHPQLDFSASFKKEYETSIQIATQ